jgi:hypothetical protein
MKTKDNMSVTAEKCMDAIREHVGTVELEQFIYYVRYYYECFATIGG